MKTMFKMGFGCALIMSGILMVMEVLKEEY